MKELLIDYSTLPRMGKSGKIGLISLGSLLIVYNLVLFLIDLFKNELTPASVIGNILLVILGVLLILQAVGTPWLIPKKFMHITADFIEFKLGRFRKSVRLEWKAVEKVTRKKNALYLHAGEKVTKIPMILFPSSDENKIRATIKSIAEAKNIQSEL